MTECYNWCITQEIGVEIFSLTYSENAYLWEMTLVILNVLY